MKDSGNVEQVRRKVLRLESSLRDFTIAFLSYNLYASAAKAAFLAKTFNLAHAAEITLEGLELATDLDLILFLKIRLPH